jgi:transcription elongation factor Elf1
MYIKKCKWCDQDIEVEKQPLFALHVANCKSNPNLDRLKKETSLRFKGVLKSERITVEKKCPRCGDQFEVISTESLIRRNKVKNYCSDECARARIHTVESKRKISESLIKGNYVPANKGRRSNSLKYKFSCIKCGKEGIDSKYRKNRKYHKECWLSISGGIKKGSSRGKCGWYKGYWCDSSYELAFIIYNLDHGIKFERNKMGFRYEFEGEFKLFYPDFIINGDYVEIKNYKSDLTDAKICNFPHKIDVVYKTDITKYTNYVIDKYGKDFIKLYEQKTMEYQQQYQQINQSD